MLNLLLISTTGLAVLMLAACSDNTPSAPLTYPEGSSPAARLFQKKCSACHVAPQPDMHTAKIWFAVVQRMQMRMKAKGITPLDKTDLAEILDYLQRNAAVVEPKPAESK